MVKFSKNKQFMFSNGECVYRKWLFLDNSIDAILSKNYKKI